MMKHLVRILKKKEASRIILLLVVDYLFFSFTNAITASSFFIIIAFILSIVTIYYLYQVLLQVVGVYVIEVQKTRKSLAIFLTVVSGLLLALQSLGQLTVREVLIILPTSFTIYLYLTYARLRVNLRDIKRISQSSKR